MTAIVSLVSSMINNEPNLVSVLLKPAEEEPAIINKLLSVLVKFPCKTQTYFYIQTDAFESICLKFFARLTVTENGKKVVNDLSLPILDQMLSAKLETYDPVFSMGR